jgi:predicted metal-dependent peptidase
MRELTAEQRVDGARITLITEFPFYGSIFLNLNTFESDLNKTAWTDGVSIGYNLEYTKTLTEKQIIGMFVHEVKHVMLKHHLRELENKEFMDNHHKYNCACDYALNPMIKNTPGMDVHRDWLCDMKRWPDNLAEEIFYEVDEKDLPPEGSYMLPGEVLPFPGTGGYKGANSKGQPVRVTIADIDAEKQKIDQWIRAAAFKAQGQGKLDGNMQDMIKAVTASTVSWQDELIFLCEDVSRDDYSWTRPNVRYMQAGVYLPSMKGNKTVDMIFFVDTSGSLSSEQLSMIAAEIQEIVGNFNIRVIVVYWDTSFRGMEIFDATDVMDPAFNLDISGRGGTNFEGCFDWMFDKQYEFDFDPKAMVFFSDMECDQYPEDDPGMPMLWCQVPYCYGGMTSWCDDYLEYVPDYGKLVRVPIYAGGD